jgi:hypothetical protein
MVDHNCSVEDVFNSDDGCNLNRSYIGIAASQSLPSSIRFTTGRAVLILIINKEPF